VRNTLAVVQALAVQTDDSDSVDGYREEFIGRLSAPARATAYCSIRNGGARSAGRAGALQVYRVDRPAVLEMQGEPVPFSPSESLGSA
jgi:hypothetical protein